MKRYKNGISHTIKPEIEWIKCDKCGTEYNISKNHDDAFEIQEFLSINFTGGYGSINGFGDCVKVECDIYQRCLYKMIKSICRKEEQSC